MTGTVEASSTDIYEAVVALSRSIAGRTDLRSLLSGVAELSSPDCPVQPCRDEPARSEWRCRCRGIF